MTGNQSISVLSPDDTRFSPSSGFLEERGLFRYPFTQDPGNQPGLSSISRPSQVGRVKLCTSVQIRLIAAWATVGFQPTKCHFCLQAVLMLSFSWCRVFSKGSLQITEHARCGWSGRVSGCWECPCCLLIGPLVIFPKVCIWVSSCGLVGDW